MFKALIFIVVFLISFSSEGYPFKEAGKLGVIYINAPFDVNSAENLDDSSTHIFLKKSPRGFDIYPHDSNATINYILVQKAVIGNPAVRNHGSLRNVNASPYEFSQWVLGKKSFPDLDPFSETILKKLNITDGVIKNNLSAQKKIQNAYDAFQYHLVGQQGAGFYPFCSEVVDRYVQEKTDFVRVFSNSIGLMGYSVTQEPFVLANRRFFANRRDDTFVIFMESNLNVEASKHEELINGDFFLFDSRNRYIKRTNQAERYKQALNPRPPRQRTFTSFKEITGCFEGSTQIETLFVPNKQSYKDLTSRRTNADSMREWKKLTVNFGSLEAQLDLLKATHHAYVLSSTLESVDDPRYQMDCWSSIRTLKQHPNNMEDSIRLTADAGETEYFVSSTPEHRFYVYDDSTRQTNWIEAADIQPNMYLIQGTERYSINNITRTKITKPQTVYNLTVGTHLYYAGAGDERFLVHNFE